MFKSSQTAAVDQAKIKITKAIYIARLLVKIADKISLNERILCARLRIITVKRPFIPERAKI